MLFCRWTYNRTGFTLVEMLLVTVIGLMAAVMTVSFFMTGSRMTASIASQNRVNRYGGAPIEVIKNVVRMGNSMTVASDGMRLDVDNPDGTTASFYYQDDDGSSATLHDSKLMHSGSADAEPRRLLSMINLSSGVPLFTWAGGNSPLTIRMRFGDSPNDFGNTGIGVQALDVVTTVTGRNRL